MLLAVLMAIFMREDHFEPAGPEERETWGAMGRTLLDGVAVIRGQAVLMAMILVTAIFGAFSEGIDRLFTPYLIGKFDFPSLGPLDTVTWWGIIAAGSSLLGLASTTAVRRYVDLTDQRRLTVLLSACLVTIAALVLALANLDGFPAVLVCFWLVGALRSVYGPVMTAWLNRLFPERGRATLFSMYGQADAVGQVAGGPVIGFIARTVSIGFALSVSALALLPTLALFSGMAKRLGRDTVSGN